MTRNSDVTKLSFDEAVTYFMKKGVGVNGVRTQRQLNEALNDHRYAFPVSGRLAKEIEGYLLTHGYRRADIKATHKDVVESRRLRSGRAKASPWLILRLKLQNWWQKRN